MHFNYFNRYSADTTNQSTNIENTYSLYIVNYYNLVTSPTGKEPLTYPNIIILSRKKSSRAQSTVINGFFRVWLWPHYDLKEEMGRDVERDVIVTSPCNINSIILSPLIFLN